MNNLLCVLKAIGFVIFCIVAYPIVISLCIGILIAVPICTLGIFWLVPWQYAIPLSIMILFITVTLAVYDCRFIWWTMGGPYGNRKWYEPIMDNIDYSQMPDNNDY